MQTANITFGGENDTTGLSVLSITPGDTATSVNVTESVTVTFNEPIDSTTVDSNSIQVLNSGSAVSGSFTISDA